MPSIDPYTDLADEVVVACLKAAFDDSIDTIFTHSGDIAYDAKLRPALLTVLRYYMTEEEYLEWEEE